MKGRRFLSGLLSLVRLLSNRVSLFNMEQSTHRLLAFTNLAAFGKPNLIRLNIDEQLGVLIASPFEASENCSMALSQKRIGAIVLNWRCILVSSSQHLRQSRSKGVLHCFINTVLEVHLFSHFIYSVVVEGHLSAPLARARGAE